MYPPKILSVYVKGPNRYIKHHQTHYLGEVGYGCGTFPTERKLYGFEDSLIDSIKDHVGKQNPRDLMHSQNKFM